MTTSSERGISSARTTGGCAVASGQAIRFRGIGLDWPRRDVALKAFVDQWLHIATEDGSFKRIYAAWFE